MQFYSQTMAQALSFTSDFKLGHYMKIPPRPMFLCQVWVPVFVCDSAALHIYRLRQVVATVIAGTVQLGVQAWMFSNIP
jgi:hypothetical protein